ncbi:hypothetical protein ACJX0J_028110, partial [Zea mays]
RFYYRRPISERNCRRRYSDQYRKHECLFTSKGWEKSMFSGIEYNKPLCKGCNH